ncbi:MAG TPA: methyltransferase domain-containing protein [Kofleriaceae bacterium]|nr:methyltransferase domain-containing protein [Kofleriaceae bacterium]
MKPEIAEEMPFYLPGSPEFVQGLQLFLRHTNEYDALLPWYDRFIDSLPVRNAYLEIGAGDGSSLTAHADRRFRFGVVVEKNEELVPSIRAHCPSALVLSRDWNELTEGELAALVAQREPALLGGERGLFDLVQLAHVLYYFAPAQQRLLLRRLAPLVRPGGAMLLCLQDESSDFHALYHTFSPHYYNLRHLGEWFAAEFEDQGWRVTSEVLSGEVTTDQKAIAQQIAEFMICYLPFAPLPRRAALARWVETKLWRAAERLYVARNPQRVVVCRQSR